MQYGEIVNLGVHRLMCGDAKKREDVEKLISDDKVDLVLTDPPYGMKIQSKVGNVGGGNPNIAFQQVAQHMYTIGGNNGSPHDIEKLK